MSDFGVEKTGPMPPAPVPEPRAAGVRKPAENPAPVFRKARTDSIEISKELPLPGGVSLIDVKKRIMNELQKPVRPETAESLAKAAAAGEYFVPADELADALLIPGKE